MSFDSEGVDSNPNPIPRVELPSQLDPGLIELTPLASEHHDDDDGDDGVAVELEDFATVIHANGSDPVPNPATRQFERVSHSQNAIACGDRPEPNHTIPFGYQRLAM
jgi:hypothetical protein